MTENFTHGINNNSKENNFPFKQQRHENPEELEIRKVGSTTANDDCDVLEEELLCVPAVPVMKNFQLSLIMKSDLRNRNV